MTENNTVSINPATGEKIGEYPVNTVEELQAAIKRSRQAQAGWGTLPVKSRTKQIKLIADFMMDNIDRITDIISKENGKTRFDALSTEVAPALMATDFYCRNAEKFLKDKKLPLGNVLLFNKRSKIVREPYGVVGVISPWNYPFCIPYSDVIIALLCGNGVILKVATAAQATGYFLKECIDAAKLPEGLFSYVNIPGKIAGDAFLDNGIDKLLFTGSVATGKYLMKKASETLTPLLLELGGNDAMIVCEDADLDRAANGALWGGFSTCGQSCAGVERIYVHKNVYEPFLQKLKVRIERLRIGPDQDYQVDLGAITLKRQLEKIKLHIDDALKKGAKIYAQSQPPSAPTEMFIPAMVLTDVNHDMIMMQEETFGPVVAVMPVADMEEAVRLANDSMLGLTGSVWSRNRKMAEAVARRIKAGVITVNDHLMSHGMAETPWGGFKQSGFGRTHGYLGFEEMTQSKTIVHDILPTPKNLWWYPFSKGLYDGMKGGLFFLYGKRDRLKGLLSLLKIVPRMFQK